MDKNDQKQKNVITKSFVITNNDLASSMVVSLDKTNSVNFTVRDKIGGGFISLSIDDLKNLVNFCQYIIQKPITVTEVYPF